MVQLSRYSHAFAVSAVSLSLALLAVKLPVSLALSQDPTAPRYTANGELLLPTGFREWIFVGSNLGMAYRPDLDVTTAAESGRARHQAFHNVYIDPAAYAHFEETSAFPDPTVLVMERLVAVDREPQGIVSAGMFNGDRIGLEAAVKNSRRPDGSRTTWAYYNFSDPAGGSEPKASAAAFPDAACESCHRRHAGQDNVWVQFYPALRKKAR